MTPDEPSKMVIIATHGIDDAERATLPLVVGNAALAMDSKVVLVLQGSGVTIATRGLSEHILAPGFDPVAKLLASFFEFGGKVLVCIPCLGPRNISVDNLLPGSEPIKAARLVQEVQEADTVLGY
jgi:predicted peroxiredoxin